jgi:DNA-directed RNA polymerase subunit alpha
MDQKAPDARIEELDFSVRTYNCLKKANTQTIADLVQTTEEDLMNIRNFGRKSLLEVREKLAQFGLTLAGAPLAEPGDGDEDEEGEE